MAFKFKDLMVEVNPGAARACGPTFQTLCQNLTCWGWTGCHFRSNWDIVTMARAAAVGCGPVSFIQCGPTIFCDGSIDPTVASGDPAHQLQQLKTSLREALERVEAQEKDLAASQRPQTLAEANQLEKKLQSAIEELHQQKKELK